MNKLAGLFFACSCLSALGQQPVISEFLAINTTGLRDLEKEPQDWIELHNPTAQPLSIDGYFLTDDAQDLNKWRLPALTLPPQAYALVFASGKDRRDPATELHTNFKLHPMGEYLGLVAPDGKTIVQEFGPQYPPQRLNASFGILGADKTKAGFLAEPTPGQANGGAVTAAGPLVLDITHSPKVPKETEDIVITAKVRPAPKSVILTWRVMYQTPVETPMADDGKSPDAKAGDGIYSVVIPSQGQSGPNYKAGQMVRWFFTATDEAGAATRLPGYHDPKNSPQFFGTVVHNPAVTTPLPVLQRFIENVNASNGAAGTRCSVFYLDEFYDNAFVRIRGDTARSWPKKSYKMEFNDGHHFRFREDLPRVDEFNLNSTYTDKSYARAILAYELNRDTGTPSPIQQHVRVQQNGEFFSVALMVEQPDGEFLERNGLDRDGGLYKGVGGANFTASAPFEKKSRRWEAGKADLDAFNKGLRLTGDALAAFLFDNVDMPAQINFMACNIITQNIDASNKNYYAYRDTNGTGEWQMTPWDIDLTFGPDALNTDLILADENTKGASNPNTPHPFLGGRQFQLHADKFNALLDQMFKNPQTREMLLRRTRSLMDRHLMNDYFDKRLDQLVAYLDADVLLDKAKWKTQNHFSGKTYTLQQAADRIKNEYLARRRVFLDKGGKVDIPKSQPANARLTVEEVDFNPASGNQDEEYIKIGNPNEYAVDISDWRIEGGIKHRFKPGTVIPPRGSSSPVAGSLYLVKNTQAFRARKEGVTGGKGLLIQGNYENHLSNFGETLVIRNDRGEDVVSHSYEGQPSLAQKNLVITEVMYAPKDNPNAEFIELWNRGADALDLSGLTFTRGIEFVFPANTKLEPGKRLLIVKNRAEFEKAYGAGLPIAGEFANGTALANEGERVKLEDKASNTIVDFTYNNQAPWPEAAAGAGHSLVLRRADAKPDGDDPANWRASRAAKGNPNDTDLSAFAGDRKADRDGDGRSAFAEHALGSSDETPDHRSPLNASVGWKGDRPDVLISFHRNASADDAGFRLEGSSDLRFWGPLTGNQLELTEVATVGNREKLTYKLRGSDTRYVRLTVLE